MHRRYQDRVEFLTVYVREAHPTDGWRMAANDKADVAVAQPTTAAARTKVADTCRVRLNMTVPLLIDTLDDRVGHAYSGMPDRLYVIDTAGRVAYQGGRGPFGFKPAEMEQALLMLLLDEATAKAAPAASAWVPVLDSDAAWRCLPPAERGAGQPLPAWACATARTLPRTTAAMLQLDYRHRSASPLAPRLRGLLRWAAADANRCPYTQAQALADLRRAGVAPGELEVLLREPMRLPPAEQRALRIARKLTTAAYTVTDAEFAELLRTHGEAQVVAMVQLLAYANFQDRLILSLGLGAVQPLPPLDVRFAVTTGDPAPRTPPGVPVGPAPAAQLKDPEWLAFSYTALQEKLTHQRARSPRIRVPTAEEWAKQNGKAPPRPLRIQWSLVCGTYQPELAQGWSACTRAFGSEAREDRAFEELLFWVVTRSNTCFY